MARQKMSNKTFLCIWVPILAILLATIIAVTCVMNAYSVTLDNFLGRGERHVTNVEGTETWDLEFNKPKYATTEEALKAATEVSRRIGNEGFVLLKNGGTSSSQEILPLKEGSAVTPFGYRYFNPVYSVLGSGAVYDGMHDYSCTNPESETMESAIASNFEVNEEIVAKMRGATAEQVGEAPGTTPCQTIPYINACSGSNTFLTEYNASIYAGAAASCEDTTGLVFIGRDAGEGGDLKLDAYADGTEHELQLSKNEKETIRFAKQACDGVVAVINSCSLMELDILMSGEYEVDAVVWIGYPGSIGCQSLSDLLCGKENFSGKTVDLWAADFTADPTYQNMKVNRYNNVKVDVNGEKVDTPFVEYEEGIYVGYRYYETADEMDDSFDYDAAVVYPFGYGLSYTSFEQEIVSFNDMGDDVVVEVRVTNTGDVAGKGVVQLYYTAPYTDYDRENAIEKAAVNLAAFDKTGVIQPDGSETLTLTFAKEDMASYSYMHDNGDGTRGCYILEEGEYIVSLRSDSHTVIDSRTTEIGSTVYFDNDNPRRTEKDGQSLLDDEGKPLGIPAKAQQDASAEFVAATNRFDEVTDYMRSNGRTILSRSDWKGTFPTAPTAADLTAPEDVVYTLEHYNIGTFDVENDPVFGNVEGSIVYREEAPTSNADNGLTLSDLRGLDYYAPEWELLLDQIDYDAVDELTALLYGGAYTINTLSSIGLPVSNSAEGPSGIGLFADLLFGKLFGASDLPDMCAYCSNMVIASTWNTDLAYEAGNSVAQESFFYGKGEGNYLCGWTGPGVNLHRSPFNGRNGEYYSEDPVLAGQTATAQISGAADGGLYTIFKHFAVNNVEQNRTNMCVWVDEQAMRELYLKVFEQIFKEARKTISYIADNEGTVATKVMRGSNSVMGSMNCIGAMPAGSNYALLTEVLRGEWGFQGYVQTDMPNFADKDLNLRTGADMEMNMSAVAGKDMTSPTMQWCIRNAVHNIAYCVVNSRAMNGIAPGAIITYDMSPWMIGLIVANVVVYAFVVGMATYVVIRVVKAKKHPEQYKH